MASLTDLERLSHNVPDDKTEQQKLHNAALKLARATESEADFVQRVMYTSWELSIAHTAANLGIFEILVKHDGQSLNVRELAEVTKADEALIGRLMRALAAYSLIDEVGIDTFKAGRFTKTLTLPGLHAGLIFHSWSNDLALRMPQFLAKNNYRNPSDSTKSIAVDHYGMQPWEYFGKNPELGMHFAKWLTVYQMGQGSWLDVFPVEQHLGGVDADKVAFVDVGGSTGSQSLALRKAFSGITGKVVVQDLPHVIETADTAAGADVGVEFQVYDFTTEQPIKGARCYYLKNIIHDWADEQALVILGRQIDAMDESSVLMLNEMVIPAKGASWQSIQLDWQMMLLSALERTEPQWRRLLEKAKLRVESIQRFDEGTAQSIILCRKQ